MEEIIVEVEEDAEEMKNDTGTKKDEDEFFSNSSKIDDEAL